MKAWETAAKERARKAMTRIFDLVGGFVVPREQSDVRG
jgi:hypothetical protein